MITINDSALYRLGLYDIDIAPFLAYLKHDQKVSVMDRIGRKKVDILYNINPRVHSFHTWDTWEEGEVLKKAESVFATTLYPHTLYLNKKYLQRGKHNLKYGDLVRFESVFGKPIMLGEDQRAAGSLTEPAFVRETGVREGKEHLLLDGSNTSVNFHYWFQYSGDEDDTLVLRLYYGQ